MRDPIREALARAVTYTLDRAAREPEGLGAHIGLTQTEELLITAEALHLGRDPRRHRIHRHGGVPARVLAAWEAYDRGERATIELAAREEDDDSLVTVETVPTDRVGLYVVHPEPEGNEYGLTHGPSGMRMAEGARAHLLVLAYALDKAAPSMLEPDYFGHDAAATRAVRDEIDRWKARLREERERA